MSHGASDFIVFIKSLIRGSSGAAIDCDNPDNNAELVVSSFISNSSPDALFVLAQGNTFQIHQHLSPSNTDPELVLVFVKHEGILNADMPFISQVQVVNIPLPTLGMDGESKAATDSYDQLQDLISLAITPYFDYVSQAKSPETLNSTSITSAKKRFNELSLSLKHMKHVLEVPDLLLSVPQGLMQILKRPEASRDSDVLSDTSTLNELTKTVNQWIRSIQYVTYISRTSDTGESLLDEVRFWSSLESALVRIYDQIKQPEVTNAIEILSAAKRFQVSLAFQNNLGISEKMEEAQTYTFLLRDLPVSDLVFDNESIPTISQFEDTIVTLFAHLKKWKTSSSIPLTGIIKLVEVVLNEIALSLCKLVSNANAKADSDAEFDELYHENLPRVFSTINSNVKFMVNVIRELMRKRQEKFMVVKIESALLNKIRDRVENIKFIRHKHEDLLYALKLFEDSEKFVEAITLAYDKYIALSSPFDFSNEGLSIWKVNSQLYLETQSTTQEAVRSIVNRNLERCHRFTDYYFVFSKFQSRSSGSLTLLDTYIDEKHKLDILDKAYTDVHNLILLFDVDKYSEVLAKPTLCQIIMYEESLRAKLLFYLVNLEKFLGENWRRYSVGSRIDMEANAQLKILDSEMHFSEWIQETTERLTTHQRSDEILYFEKIEEEDTFNLFVKYDMEKFEKLYETKELISLGFVVPSKIIMEVERVKVLKPIVQSFTEHIQLFTDTLNLRKNAAFGIKFGFLVEDQVSDIFAAIKDMMSFEWSQVVSEINSSDLDEHCPQFASQNFTLGAIEDLQNRIYNIHMQMNTIQRVFTLLDEKLYPQILTCSFSKESIESIIHEVEQSVARIIRSPFYDLPRFVSVINEDTLNILSQKCCLELSCLKELTQNGLNKRESKVLDGLPLTRHELTYNESKITITPSLETSKQNLFMFVDGIISVINSQKMITLKGERKNFSVTESDSLSAALATTLSAFDDQLMQAKEYLRGWKNIEKQINVGINFEAHFDSKLLLDGIKDSLHAMEDLISNKKLLGDGNGMKELGIIQISFLQIQPKVQALFQSSLTQTSQAFCNKIHEILLKLSNEMNIAQGSLSANLDFAESSLSALKKVSDVMKYQSMLPQWRDTIQALFVCQSTVSKIGISVPEKWLYVEQLDNQFQNINSVLNSKLEQIQTHIDTLALTYNAQYSRINEESGQLEREWQNGKPVSPFLDPASALSVLARFQASANKMSLQLRPLLELQKHFPMFQETNSPISVIEDELRELKFVWTSLQDLWAKLELIKTQKWKDCSPRHIKQDLENILVEMKKCPISVRQYSAFETLMGLIKQILDTFGFISELKSDSIQDRHLEQIMEISDPKSAKKSTALLVGDVIGIDYKLHEANIRAVLEQAHAEQLVHSSLVSIEEEWSMIVFELFSFGGKCRLVKNWKVLYDQCDTSLSTLHSIERSNSSIYLERERQDLESKLNDFKSIIDVWVEVQRQWIYLDGVFAPNAQIRSSLPLEATRFNNISIEFLSLNKRLTTCKRVLDILNIKGSFRALSKISESLVKTVKGLTDFLDKQRQLFARLFFIGNEDFLELLGSGTNAVTINKHIKSMFSGIKSVTLDSNSSSIVGIVSPQGESVDFNSPVSLIKFHDLTSWLQVFEKEVKLTLATSICDAITSVKRVYHEINTETINVLLAKYPAQALIVAFQVFFSELLSKAHESKELEASLGFCEVCIKVLTALASESDNPLSVGKLRSLLVEVIFYSDSLKSMSQVSPSEKSRILNSLLLYHCNLSLQDPLERVWVSQGRFVFSYGFEYQGVTERLAMTPLVTDCFLAMTQAIAQKQGGSSFGPAGTGKTECVKALGQNLGRMVLVFNCDDSFDFRSMGRILLGICQVGCWGCFDEFNRLEKEILSTLSSEVEHVEHGLKSSEVVAVSGKEIIVNQNTGIFVTMNPGYSGRNELPENLKKHFRGFSMDRPEELKIAQVIMSSYGFVHAEELANIAIPFFKELKQSVSKQLHYDFGLRALKTVLRRAGRMRKEIHLAIKSADVRLEELQIFASCLEDTVLPQLVDNDCVVFSELTSKFLNVKPREKQEVMEFSHLIKESAISKGYEATDELLKKTRQLYQIQQAHHGFMLVGKSGSGKSLALNLVLDALADFRETRCEKFIIDSKVMSKDKLFGYLDPITRDWTDGLFTKILRGILADLKGESSKITWIIFDGDVDPEWAENLNSLLDDNKLLTLPNGERLELPENVKIVFEVTSLSYVTPATVSRCGMVWFDISTISCSSIWHHRLHLLKHGFEVSPERNGPFPERIWTEMQSSIEKFDSHTILDQIGQFAAKLHHIMAYNNHYAIASFFTYFHIHCSKLLTEQHTANIDIFVRKSFFLSFIWGYAGDSDYSGREELRKYLTTLDYFANLEAPQNISKTKLSFPDFEWTAWSDQVESVDLEPHKIMEPGIIVPTVDTVMHEALVRDIVNKHSPLIMCGPPGSGKTMTLLKALRDSPDLDATPINFSKDTTPHVLLATLEQYCEYKVSKSGIILTPRVNGKWVVVFCDEINLPSTDKYGTQKVISFMRQLIEHGGFWRPKDLTWVNLQNVQFVGACNDPNDPGRNKLDDRLLRHSTVVMVDYPGPESMKTIYQTFNSAILKCAPDIRSFAGDLTESMIQVYDQTRAYLDSSKMSHYIYSPRELTRWCRGILETIMNVAYHSLPELIRLWYHEGLRLFYDRLVSNEDKIWCKDLFRNIAAKNFGNTDLDSTLQEPVLYSKWMTGEYEPVDQVVLKKFVKERLRVFSEEESEVDLILFGDMLDHALRIDRVLRQHQGHMILVGPHTSGKSTLTKFVAWMNGLCILQLRTHTGYTIREFEQTLRDVLLRCAKGEQICFLIDESNIMDTSFIERMNTLLANSEIPGLFEDEDLDNLNKVCVSESTAMGYVCDSDDELNAWLVSRIAENLHVVFTMSGLDGGNNPQVNSSPALFNRCVLSWMGDWGISSLSKVSEHFVNGIPTDCSNYSLPSSVTPFSKPQLTSLKDSIVDVLTWIHSHTLKGQKAYPKQFLDLNRLFVTLHAKCLSELEENQRHTNAGLDKLRETVLQVSEMKKIMHEKKIHLQNKDDEAKQMLNKMIVQQNEAERKREFSEATKVELEKQEIDINTRRHRAMSELELAEPAVLEAQRGVQNIKKQHLTEMRSMANPPASIKMAMESVCVLLGYQVSSWRDVQSIVRKDDFIYSIVSFDSETHLSFERRKHMEETYLSRSDYNYEAIDRASKACGPLFLWVTAQLRYSSILEKIGPLRAEVEALESSANRSRAHLIAIAQMIEELGQSIENYKNDYSELIRETERVKTEMTQIEAKVDRSMKLIENLTKERKKWQASIENFESGKQKIVGNAILGAAFSTYCGALSQGSRDDALESWKERLLLYDIAFDPSLEISSLLSTADQRAVWRQSGLSRDSLFVGNFSISSWSEPSYIVDPSGSLIDTLQSVSLPNKLTVTSFLHHQFLKAVEDALRFGGTVLISNAEAYNPILDPVIRQEVFRTGGRKTIHFGGKSIVLSEAFKLILFTRDSKSEIPVFLRSRATVLNFSVTRSNINNRILDLSLEHSEPALFAQKNEILSLQSDYYVRLLNLRKELLLALNNVKGTILDNDELIMTLESLETESSEIVGRMSDSQVVMATVEKSRAKFSSIAVHMQNIYDIMMYFGKRSVLYNFPLGEIIDVFVDAFKNRGSMTLAELTASIYHQFHSVFSPTLRRLDRVCFEVCLVTSFHGVEAGARMLDFCTGLVQCITGEEKLQDVLMRFESNNDKRFEAKTEDGELGDLLLSVKEKNPCVQVLSAFIETAFTGSTPSFSRAVAQYIKTVFPLQEFDFDSWARRKSSPILFCTSDHYDVSYRVHQSAKTANVPLMEASMGTKEGIELAYKLIEKGMAQGTWVLIENIQFSKDWLTQLALRLETSNPHQNFRLYLTCSLDSSIPSGIVELSRVLTIEAQPPWKDMLRDAFTMLAESATDANQLHLYFMLSWFHTTIMERLKYTPLGFKQHYDFSESDLAAAAFVLQSIFSGMDQQKVAEHQTPWSEIAYRIGVIIYGGKISDPEDSLYCVELARYLLAPQSLRADFNLVHNQVANDAGLHVVSPNATTRADYISWIEDFSVEETMMIASLPMGVLDDLKEREAGTIAQETLHVLQRCVRAE